LNERNLGYAISNNRAALLARGEFLALLNNDLVLQPGWLEPMLSAHARLRQRAGLIGNMQPDTRTGAVGQTRSRPLAPAAAWPADSSGAFHAGRHRGLCGNRPSPLASTRRL